jgi:hypothetical protein
MSMSTTAIAWAPEDIVATLRSLAAPAARRAWHQCVDRSWPAVAVKATDLIAASSEFIANMRACDVVCREAMSCEWLHHAYLNGTETSATRKTNADWGFAGSLNGFMVPTFTAAPSASYQPSPNIPAVALRRASDGTRALPTK